MSKAIFMIYLFVFFLIGSLFVDDMIVDAFCMAGAFACGMFSFYFLSAHAKAICSNEA